MGLDLYMTCKEVAELLRVTPRTIFNWRKKMGMPSFKPSPHKLLFEFADVWRWAKSNKDFMEHTSAIEALQDMAIEIESSIEGD